MAETGWLDRLKAGLYRTRQQIMRPLGELIGRGRLDEEFFAGLEALLIQADMGVLTVDKLLARVREQVARERASEPRRVKEILAREILAILAGAGGGLDPHARGVVYLFVGVNGVGKTTTLAKLAGLMRRDGLRVLLVAADTFRAAATEQLQIWGERLGLEVIHHQAGADPAAVCFDGLAAAEARGYDVVLIDTAGRLHTQANLLAELRKVRRVVEANLKGRALKVVLVLDATTGQNALQQAEVFREAAGSEVAILTKLDGTAKGGVIVALADRLRLPIAMIGVGESAGDLRPFVPEEFVAALFAEA
ncbi:MAG: signal recognition particle-docking protein FtsY [Patescibacteria group bacterium]